MPSYQVEWQLLCKMLWLLFSCFRIAGRVWIVAYCLDWYISVVEYWTHDYIVTDLIPGESCGRIFFSELNFSICSSHVFTAIAFKRPGCSAKSAGGRLQLQTHTPLTQHSWSWLPVLPRHSVGNREKSSHASRGVRIDQWLECRTYEWKVTGSCPCQSSRRIFFSRVIFLCWLLFWYPVPPLC